MSFPNFESRMFTVKKSLHVFLILFLSGALKVSCGQTVNYIDSLANWNEYNEYVFYPGNWQFTDYTGINFRLNGDTILSGKSYRKLFWGDTWYEHVQANPWSWYGGNYYPVTYELLGALRIDSSGKMFFCSTVAQWSNIFCFHASMEKDSEVLLYDFNLEVGDTSYIPGWGIRTVQSIDSILLLNGETRKRINFNDGDSWIPGMGSVFGLFVPLTGPPFEGGCYLSCYWESNEIAYQSQNVIGDVVCDSLALGVKNIETDFQDVTVSPNPSSTYINIVYSIEHNATLTFTDAYGRVAKQLTLYPYFKNRIIDVAELPAGMYLVTLTSGNQSFSQKVVKE